MREAFPESCPYRYVVLDRDGKFGEEVTELLSPVASNLHGSVLQALGKAYVSYCTSLV
jgi:hypothetical protein